MPSSPQIESASAWSTHPGWRTAGWISLGLIALLISLGQASAPFIYTLF